MIKNEKTGEKYSVEYFNEHIPSEECFCEYIEQKYPYTSSRRIYKILKEAEGCSIVNNERAYIYHVDTYLLDNMWRVQLHLNAYFGEGECKTSPIVIRALNLAARDFQLFTDYKLSGSIGDPFAKITLTLTFDIPFVE